MRMTAGQHARETDQQVELSIVIPVYGCAGTLIPLHERLTAVLSHLVDSYETVFHYCPVNS